MFSFVKKQISAIISDEMKGSLDYYRFVSWRNTWGSPFNGQVRRMEIFSALLSSFKPEAIMETGSFKGTTTAYFADTSLPVYTVESYSRNYIFARKRLRNYKNVVIFKDDSRAWLNRMLNGPLRNLRTQPIFFYLDAHWNADLPLSEELDIIFSNTSHAVVMIDDFEVPGDVGYAFDDYGAGNILSSSYLESHVVRYSLVCFYPEAPSETETGARRGCIILTTEEDAAIIDNPTLRRSTKNVSATRHPLHDLRPPPLGGTG